jgi:WD40 repeat protein
MPIYQIGFSPDGRRIATTGSSGEEAVIVWDVPTRRPVATLEGKGSRFNWVTFSPDGNTIAAVALDAGRLHLWRAPSWAEIDATGNESNLVDSSR